MSTLARLIGAGPLLLDFDGPVCSIFAGYPASRVATELLAVVGAEGIAIPEAVYHESDPLAVLRWVGATCPPDVTTAAEDALCTAELEASATAAPTPFGREVILGA